MATLVMRLSRYVAVREKVPITASFQAALHCTAGQWGHVWAA